MNSMFITIKKEIRSIFRDKKTIIRMMFFPMIIPIMIFFYGYMYDDMDSSDSEYVIGINYDIDEVQEALLKEYNIVAKSYQSKDSLEDAYNDKEISGYVTLNDDNYVIYIDSGSTSGMVLSNCIQSYLDQYNKYLSINYLEEKGIDSNEALVQLTYEFEELGNQNYLFQIILVVCFTYLIMAICMATTNMAISSTATEKENGTLETLLTFPISKSNLIIGKYISSFLIGCLSSFIAFVLMILSVVIAKNKFETFNSFDLIVNFKTILGSVVIIVCASALIAGLALLLTSFSKNYKEAQSSVQFLNIISVVPMFVSLLEIDVNWYYYLIPVCNFEQVLMDLFTNMISVGNLLIVLISTLFYTAVVIMYIIRFYNSEKILFEK